MKDALKLTLLGFLIILIAIYLAVSMDNSDMVSKVFAIIGVIISGIGIKKIK
ncbi:hypothetical protein [Clostridium sp. B9]|uniref:hypothetical protein n=1 Tax=Clostridium sp. B9 TaxID=3423224 RepID=UPI003D2F375C